MFIDYLIFCSTCIYIPDSIYLVNTSSFVKLVCSVVSGFALGVQYDFSDPDFQQIRKSVITIFDTFLSDITFRLVCNILPKWMVRIKFIRCGLLKLIPGAYRAYEAFFTGLHPIAFKGGRFLRLV